MAAFCALRALSKEALDHRGTWGTVLVETLFANWLAAVVTQAVPYVMVDVYRVPDFNADLESSSPSPDVAVARRLLCGSAGPRAGTVIAPDPAMSSISAVRHIRHG